MCGIRPSTPSAVVLMPISLARFKPSDAGSIPTIHTGSSTGLRCSLASRSVPMLPGPIRAHLIFFMGIPSFECDAGVADYLGPALVFGPDVAGQALGRHGGRFGTDLREAFGDLTCAEHFGDRPMQGGGHRRRQVGRCDDAEPGRHVEAG